KRARRRRQVDSGSPELGGRRLGLESEAQAVDADRSGKECRIPEPLGELERLSREIRITVRTAQIGGIGHACPRELDENARPELELVVLIDLCKRPFEARTCRLQA